MTKSYRRDVLKGLGALASLIVAPSGLAYACEIPPADPRGWWGSGHIMTGLGNTKLIAGRTLSQSFRAIKTGYIRSVIWYNIRSTTKPGYSMGTGGNIRVRIEGSNSSGRSNGVALGGSNTLTNAASAPTFPKQVFSSPAPVEAGKIYNVTFFNTHPDATNNYVSTDCINILSRLNVSPHNPHIPDIEDAVYYRDSGGSWIKRPQTPILDLEYTDGSHQGTPYMECWLCENPRHHNARITPSQWSRQHFQPHYDMTVNKVAVAARLVSGTGDLIMEIRNEAGTVLRRAVWSYHEVLTNYQGWVPAKPVTPLSLSRSSRYSFVLRATSGVFTSYALANGSVSRGFSPSIAVPGFCEYTLDSGARWSGGWEAWDKTGRKDGTMIFYFLTA